MATFPNATAGWVDTHLHLLPGVDDGPATLEATLAMAESAIADGTTHMVVTPHANYQFRFEPARVAALCAEVQAQLGDRLHIMAGCELHLSYENVQAALANPRLFSLNASRYLLVEFPEFFDRGSMASVLSQFTDSGLTPVLAHPERNPVLQQHPEILYEYLRQGCLGQITASSFTGRFGKRAQQFSAELLQRGSAHIVASDGHSAQQRPPHLRKAHAFIAESQGADIAHALCSANPWALAFDQELPYYPQPHVEKKSFWSRLRS